MSNQRRGATGGGTRTSTSSRGLIVGAVIIGLLIAGGAVWWAVGARGTNTTPVLTATSDDWVRGPVDAPVTIVEYGDFQCPACGAYAPVVDQLLETYPTQVKLVFRHFPLLTAHPNALPAARAAEAAGKQGKFWEFARALYARQETWSTQANPLDAFLAMADTLQLDRGAFRTSYDDALLRAKITKQRVGGARLGVNSTPTFFINGTKLEKNPESLDAFKQLINAALASSTTGIAVSSTTPVSITPLSVTTTASGTVRTGR